MIMTDSGCDSRSSLVFNHRADDRFIINGRHGGVRRLGLVRSGTA